MKKIGLYSPFLANNVGGGERYLLQVAECLLPNHNVDLILQAGVAPTDKDKEALKKHFITLFNLNLEKLRILDGPFGGIGSLWDRYNFTRTYDVFYYMTDGSFFISGAKRSVVHFMIPFKEQRGGLVNKLKLSLWPVKTANAYFTKRQMEKNWGLPIDYVHWGAVDSSEFKPLPKKNIILHSGRFFSPSGGKHCKRQDILVDVFKKMCDKGLSSWQLHLIGSVDKGKDNDEYAALVTQKAKGYPIIIDHKLPFNDVKKSYGEAKIYWHATGFGLDEDEHPEAMEHLGLSTVEAMAAGCVPVVINKAGQKEIVREGKEGLLWETEEELIEKTQKVMEDSALWEEFSKKFPT